MAELKWILGNSEILEEEYTELAELMVYVSTV